MRPLLLLVLALAACSGSGSSDITTDRSRNEPVPTGSNQLHACSEGATATELVRCTAGATPSFAAAVCGDLVASNTLRVSGPLAVGGKLDASTALDVTGEVERALACDAPDLDALVRQTAARGRVIDGGAHLANVSQPSVLALGCGRYRFTSIAINNQFTLHIDGNAVIVVDGDVHIAAPLEAILAPGARLDFVVAGDFDADSMVTFRGGSTWLAVGGRLRVASPLSIQGWVVGRGEVMADSTLAIDGALFAGSLRVASPVSVSGTLAVAPDGCTAP